MATRLSLPPIFNTFYTDRRSTRYQPGSHLSKWQRFSGSPATQLVFGYYFFLILTVVSTAIFLDRSGLARNIMDRSRRQISAAYHGYPIGPDRSSLRFTTSPGMVALVTTPDGKMVGETADGIRFSEVDGTKISQSWFTNRWGLVIPQPIDGRYQLNLSSHVPGQYQLQVFLADRSGIERSTYTESLNLSRANQRFILDYYPQDPVNQSIFLLSPFTR